MKPVIFISYRKEEQASWQTRLFRRFFQKEGFGTIAARSLYRWLLETSLGKKTKKDYINKIPEKEENARCAALKEIYDQNATEMPFEEIFFDNSSLESGSLYFKRILKTIKKATVVPLILPKGALERCYAPDDSTSSTPNDVFGYEIREALANAECTIIPIFIGESGFRSADGLPIKTEDEFPVKFRALAKRRQLNGAQAITIPEEIFSKRAKIRKELLTQIWDRHCSVFFEPNTEQLDDLTQSELDGLRKQCEKEEAEFRKSAPPSAPRKSSLPLLALATAVAAGGVFFLKYRHADAPAEPKAPVTVAPGAPVEPNTDARKKADEEKAAREREEAEKAKAEEARRKAEEERLHREAEEKLAAKAAMRDALDAAVKEYVDDKADAAVIRKRLEEFEAAWDKGAEPEPKQLSAALILSAAESKKTPRLVRRLLDAGADPNALDPWGETPLHNAVRGGDADCVRLLLERGADRSLRNSNGKTPADLAAANTELQALLR